MKLIFTLIISTTIALSGCSLLPIAREDVPSANFEAAKTTGQPMTDEKFLDLPYADKSEAQKLDLYLPAGEGPYPVVIIIHGGGFQTGSKSGRNEEERMRLLIQHGFAVASINYRLSDEDIYPAQIHDAKTAVRFLRSRAGEYNLDSEKFGAWGSSAGGTLAALLGTTCGVEELEGAKLGNTEFSSCVSAAVDWFGLVDLLAMDEQFAGTQCEGGHNAPDSAESRLVGAPIQTVPKLVAKTNPMNYITEDDAAFFIQHGARDCRVPPIQSGLLAEALINVLGNEDVFYEEFENAGHGGKAFRTDENYKKVVDFFDQYLN